MKTDGGPAETQYRVVDSYSDGMCGWVEVTDGTNTERVSWAIDRFRDSQSAAIEAAKKNLKRLEARDR